MHCVLACIHKLQQLFVAFCDCLLAKIMEIMIHEVGFDKKIQKVYFLIETLTVVYAASPPMIVMVASTTVFSFFLIIG